MRPISSIITPAKEMEGKNRKSQEEKRIGKKQYVVAAFVFILATGITLTEKKLIDERGLFDGNVFKNQARYTHYNILIYIQICWLNTEMCFFKAQHKVLKYRL